VFYRDERKLYLPLNCENITPSAIKVQISL